VQTAGLALATDLTPPESHPKVVGLMYVMLLVGMIASALIFGAALANFSPGRLIQVIQGSAVDHVAESHRHVEAGDATASAGSP